MAEEFKLPTDLPALTPLELLKVISLSEASKLCGLHPDTIETALADKIVNLSPKRRGIRVGHALFLGQKKSA